MSGKDVKILDEVRRSVRRLLADELKPQLANSEVTGEYCTSVHLSLGKNGLLGPMLPEPYGMNDLWTQAVIAEEMGYVSSGFGLSALASIGLFGANVGRTGSPEQQEQYLSGIASGEKLGCWCLTEPSIGSDATGIETTCFLDGDTYVLNGTKTFITNAPIADYFIVLAREVDQERKPLEQGFQGGTAFILEREMEGLSIGTPFKKMGHRSSPTGEVFLKEVRVPRKHVLGKPGNAFADMKLSLDVERVIFSYLGLGMMQFCVDATVAYTQERKQFGKAISEFQMVKSHLADMSMRLETSRCMLNHVMAELVAGKDVTKLAAIAKLCVADASREITSTAVQCHGGYGYMEEYQVERCMRDAKLYEIGAGTSEIQKLVITRALLKEYEV